ncbi:MAG: ketopantoate reductase family protein [Proteobacteria bacterium]|nr:ketopantoate reductase family protein [Pseudomonadota bacterium]
MRILVIGPGAVGGYFGGRLCKEGDADVTFAARGKTLDRLLEQGLVVRSTEGDFGVYPCKAASLDRINENFDIVLVCVKNYHLGEVLPLLPRACGENTACISLLNGLGSEEAISEVVGKERTIGGVAFIVSLVESPGVIVHNGAGWLKIGRLDRRSDERLNSFQAVCNKAGISCKLSRDIVYDLWQKLLWNASFNAVTALGHSDTAEVLAVKEAEGIVREAMAEIVRVAQAHGVSLDSAKINKVIENTRARDTVRTSMHDDAEQKKRIEADAINGSVVVKAKDKNIPVPVNQTLYGLVKLLDKRAIVTHQGSNAE